MISHFCIFLFFADVPPMYHLLDVWTCKNFRNLPAVAWFRRFHQRADNRDLISNHHVLPRFPQYLCARHWCSSSSRVSSGPVVRWSALGMALVRSPWVRLPLVKEDNSGLLLCPLGVSLALCLGHPGHGDLQPCPSARRLAHVACGTASLEDNWGSPLRPAQRRL